jgi:hypothetical protein
MVWPSARQIPGALGLLVVEGRFEALRGPALTPIVGRDEEVDLLSAGHSRRGHPK